ncbi:MAG: calcium-binding protein [Bosea sp. (in: a-proteobacteria)]
MIAIKALRPDQPRDLSADDLYRKPEAEPQRSRLPAALALAVTAIALYVKSLFPSQATPVPSEARPEAEEQGAQPAARQQAQDAAPDDAAPEDQTGSIAGKSAPADPGAPRAIGSGGPFEAAPGLPDFLGIDSPAIDYEQLPLPRFRAAEFEPGVGRESNDNGRAVPLGSGGAGGGGGGGGGGGSGAAEAEQLARIENPLANLPSVSAPFNPVIVVAPTGPDAGDGEEEGEDDEGPGGETPVDPRPNRAPRVAGPVYLHDIAGCQTLLLTLAALLAGASDADADALSVSNLRVSGGELTRVAEGWLFTPTPGQFGPVTLSYQVSDGMTATPQTAQFTVVEFTQITGTAAADTLLGTECKDVIEGGDGDDSIDARGGADLVRAGAGNDIVVGGAGHDIIYAGAGDDIVFGGAGDDAIYGGAGNDRLFGDDGDDVIHGEEGDDLLIGGAGNDILDGGAGDDTLHGGEGDDIVLGGAGNDTLHGEAGNDTLDGGDGADLIAAGAGDDIALGGAGADRLYGEAGHDTLRGGEGDDCLVGGEGDDVLQGEQGDDTLLGGAGADVIDGGAGRDHVRAGSGDDHVVASADASADCYEGGSGSDTLDFSGTREGVTVDMSRGRAVGIEIGEDTLIGFEALVGGEGDDCFLIGETATTLTGGKGGDVFRFLLPDERDERDEDAADDADADDADEDEGDEAHAAPASDDDAEDDADADDADDRERSSHGDGDDRALIHEILDLEVGDRIVVKQYRIGKREDEADDEAADAADDDEDDGFARIYGDEAGDSRPFRFRIEKVDEEDRTFVDVYADLEDVKDFSIEIYGNHKLYYY